MPARLPEEDQETEDQKKRENVPAAEKPRQVAYRNRDIYAHRSRPAVAPRCHGIVVKAAAWIPTWIRATGCSTRMQAKLATLARNVRYQEFPRPTCLPWAVSLVCR